MTASSYGAVMVAPRRSIVALVCFGFVSLFGFDESEVHAQTRRHETAAWGGFMSDFQLKGPVSLWFDTHYNTRAFLVLRPGLKYRFRGGPSITVGYAKLWLDPGNGTLSRHEHRPWGQVFFPAQFASNWGFSQRLRLDLRVRQNVENQAPADGYFLTPRWRSQTGISYFLPSKNTNRLFIQTALEVLVNGGSNAGPNFLDQNRVSLLFGYKRKSYTARIGYLDRFIPGTTGTAPLHEHNVLFWINYRFVHDELAKSEEGNP